MEVTTTTTELAAPEVPQVRLGTVLKIPAVRQFIALLGIAASVAAGVTVFMWSQSPSMTPLYGSLEDRDRAAVVEVLRASGIEHEIDPASGDIRVPADQVHDARMQLAAQGLPQGQAAGMESVGDSSFGVSQFMETARYQHALEAELSRTIKSLRSVREARVHLAIPRQSAFIRDQQRPSASVLLQLYSGAELESGQAKAIVNLVAGSIPSMDEGDVTLIDQFGRMLSSKPGMEEEALTTNQFRIARNLEQELMRDVEQLLAPIFGQGSIRAKVEVDMDFTVSEQTTESFDPTSQVVRSERLAEEQRRAGDDVAAGTPGAIANTPPQAGGVPAVETGEAVQTVDSSRQELRNFEVDKTISHVRAPVGTIRRLSVAVLIDESALIPPAEPVAEGDEAEATNDEDAATVAQVVEPEALVDLAEVERLVREAVGFNAARGDTVAVLSAPFKTVPDLPDDGGPAIWEDPVVRELAKQGLGVILALALAFGLVRPMLKTVVEAPPVVSESIQTLLPEPGGSVGDPAQLEGPTGGLTYQEKVAAARNITGHDPARVAQVVRKWIENDADG
ncbi:MAG: flagellar basal-body MS-ring/collar protein FliF [Pseudomonadota bacterium]